MKIQKYKDKGFKWQIIFIIIFDTMQHAGITESDLYYLEDA